MKKVQSVLPVGKTRKPVHSAPLPGAGAQHDADDTADAIEAFMLRGHRCQQACNEVIARHHQPRRAL